MSRHRRARRAIVVAFIGGAIAASIGFADEASARTETLRWRHPGSETVRYFRVHWGLRSGDYTSSISVGRPASGSEFRFDAEVPDNPRVYFAVSAVGQNGAESVFSNEISRAGLGSTPPPTTPPTTPPSTTLGQPGRPQVIGN